MKYLMGLMLALLLSFVPAQSATFYVAKMDSTGQIRAWVSVDSLSTSNVSLAALADSMGVIRAIIGADTISLNIAESGIDSLQAAVDSINTLLNKAEAGVDSLQTAADSNAAKSTANADSIANIITALDTINQNIADIDTTSVGALRDSVEANADSVQQLQDGVDSLNLNMAKKMDSTAIEAKFPDTTEIKVYLPASLIKGPGVILYGDTVSPDSLTISSSGATGSGYDEFWCQVDSPAFSIGISAATKGLASVYVQLDTSKAIRRVLTLFQITSGTQANLSSGTEYLQSGDIALKKNSGTWGVDDITAKPCGTGFWRAGDSLFTRSGVIAFGTDVSTVVDTSGWYNFRWELANGRYVGWTDVTVRTGLRVYYEKPAQEDFWPAGTGGQFVEITNSSTDRYVDTVTVSALPEGATIRRVDLILSCLNAFTYDASTNPVWLDGLQYIKVKPVSGGSWVAGITIPASRPILLATKPYSFGVELYGGNDVKAQVTEAGDYAIQWDNSKSNANTLSLSNVMVGIRLTYDYN